MKINVLIVLLYFLLAIGCSDTIDKQLSSNDHVQTRSNSYEDDENLKADFRLSFDNGMDTYTAYDFKDNTIGLNYRVQLFKPASDYTLSYLEYKLMTEYNEMSYKVFPKDDDDSFSIFKSGFDYNEYLSWEGTHTIAIYRPGQYQISARAVFTNSKGKLYKQTVFKELTFIMEYPDENEISDGYYQTSSSSSITAISNDMDDAWEETLESNYEQGMTIYIENDYFYSSGYYQGEQFECPTEGSNTTETEFTIEEEVANPTERDGRYLVAIFHTHPYLSDCPETVSRPLGASSIDEDNLQSAQIKTPAFLYDYDDSEIKVIKGTHDKNLPAKIYQYGPTRRDYTEDEYSGDHEYDQDEHW